MTGTSATKCAQSAMTMKPPAMSTASTLPAGEHARRPARMVDAERLERARDAVPQVRADDEHAEHVEGDDQRIGEVLHLLAIEVAAAGRPLRTRCRTGTP